MLAPPPFNDCGEEGYIIDCRLRLVDDGRCRTEGSCVKVAMALEVLSRAKAAKDESPVRLDFEVVSWMDGLDVAVGEGEIPPRLAPSLDSELRLGGSVLTGSNKVELVESIYGAPEEKSLFEDDRDVWEDRWWLALAWDVFVRAIRWRERSKRWLQSPF